MAKVAARPVRRKTLPVLVVVETTILGLVAMGVFAMLVDQYDRAMSIVAGRTAVAHATDAFIALSSSTPPTKTATKTAPPSRTPSSTNTPTPSRTFTPGPPTTPPPSSTPRPPTLSPTPRPPTNTPGPTRSPTPRPPAPTQWTNVAKCDTLDQPGNYRLSGDLSSNGECIKIQSSGVVLDCAGHAIQGTNYTGYGIGIHSYGVLSLQHPAYVEVRNCNVSNFTYGIYADSGDHLVIRNNNSSNNYDDTDPSTRFGKFLGMVEGGGIRVNNVTSSQILENTTLHQGIGIDVRYSNGISVRNNTSSNNSAWGINFLRTQSSEALGNTTSDNVRQCTWGAGTVGYGCDAGGIAIQDGSNNINVSNNTVTGRNGNGIFIKAHALPCGNNNSIIGNTINSVLYNAVEFGFCTGNKVDGNQIHNGLDGIWLGFAHDNEIANNTIVGMSNHGIISSNSHGTNVSGNQIISSNEGIYFYSETYDASAYSFLPAGDYRSFGNCLCSNTLQSNSIGVHLMDSTDNQVTKNTFHNNGRTFLVQGNGNGNNLQGFEKYYWPWGLDLTALSYLR